MNINYVKKLIEKNVPQPMDEDFRFSVLLPIIEIGGELNLIYEVRSKSIRQPGEISFPGGKIEDGESPEYAAVRETHEELGIDMENIEIIKELDYATSKSGSFVYTYLGYIKNTKINEIKYNEDEVSEIFYVPLSYFLENEPERYFMNYYPKADNDFPYHMVNDGSKYNWESLRYPVYFYKYKDFIIWGLTAKITYSFVRKLIGNKEV
ncbi:CoA pyrophosphatase [Sedimentibacter sp.]|uniref:NUDIX hydrolase n=1 Tax=Sedimentibacter sp. TaxID=1960295 RepID=UPI00289F0BFE|nr:CoA pyrophosphatase [Sedimentibacter sp.]